MPKISRRNLLIGGTAIAGVAALMSKPDDKSGPRAPYFLSIQQALMNAGIATPTLVIDRTRLNANIDALKGHLPEGMGYRIVAKSLPSISLIQHVAQRANTDRLMTFNLTMLVALSNLMPEASQLVGKPLPVQAARNYFEKLPATRSDAADQIQWLIDTPKRLTQYQELAKTLDRTLRLNLELDVGLHRGGFETGADLGAVLKGIKTDPNLEFAGFMGYEPHIPSLPTTLGWRDKALAGAWRTYRTALEQAADVFGSEAVAHITRPIATMKTPRSRMKCPPDHAL